MPTRITRSASEHPERSCDGKKKQDTKRSAEDAIGVMHTQRGSVNLVAYHCRFCKKWHTGHPFGRIRMKREGGR